VKTVREGKILYLEERRYRVKIESFRREGVEKRVYDSGL
jgi:hypothetical protein